MARIQLAPQVASDIERILDHLTRHQSSDPAARVRDIIAAIDVLERNPLIGRALPGDLRELVIGQGSHGYVALYRYAEHLDIVFVLAIRAQREAGYFSQLPD